MMETTASVRGVRLSAQKGRIVADMIRGKPVDKALNILAFTPKSRTTRLFSAFIQDALHLAGDEF